MADVFKALADPTRRQILLLLCQAPHSVNALAEHFDMSRPAVSKHLKVLSNNQLVQFQTHPQDGRQRHCYAHLEALEEVRVYLEELEGFWQGKLDALGDFFGE